MVHQFSGGGNRDIISFPITEEAEEKKKIGVLQ